MDRRRKGCDPEDHHEAHPGPVPPTHPGVYYGPPFATREVSPSSPVPTSGAPAYPVGITTELCGAPSVYAAVGASPCTLTAGRAFGTGERIAWPTCPPRVSRRRAAEGTVPRVGATVGNRPHNDQGPPRWRALGTAANSATKEVTR